jgi:hypothetical protein
MVRDNSTPPVLLLVFNRPDHTGRVMERIRKAAPPKLFVGADGPRGEHPEDIERCEQAREVATRVDWDCDVHTLFRDKNLGTKEAISMAISWFFDHVEEGIILEDDCLPSLSFFSFCQVLLEKYRSDERVAMISGYNPLGKWKNESRSYHFSNFGGIWGWATWKEEWNYYEEAVQASDPNLIREVLENMLVQPDQVEQRAEVIEKSLGGVIDSWGYLWFWARMLNGKISAVPSKNLVSNIGFGEGATRTKNTKDPRNKVNVHELPLPLNKSKGIYPDREYDKKWFNLTHKSRIKRIIRRIFRWN